MKKCNCGEEWADNANFCGVCGKPLNKVVEDGQAKCTCSPNGVQVKCDVHGFTGGFMAPPAT